MGLSSVTLDLQGVADTWNAQAGDSGATASMLSRFLLMEEQAKSRLLILRQQSVWVPISIQSFLGRLFALRHRVPMLLPLMLLWQTGRPGTSIGGALRNHRPRRPQLVCQASPPVPYWRSLRPRTADNFEENRDCQEKPRASGVFLISPAHLNSAEYYDNQTKNTRIICGGARGFKPEIRRNDRPKHRL